MQDLTVVAKFQPPQQLEHEQLDIVGIQGAGMLLHVSAQISVLHGQKAFDLD